MQDEYYSQNAHFEQGKRLCFRENGSQCAVGSLYPWHFFITSPVDGAGKGLFANDLIDNVLSVGGRVIVLDKRRSFKSTCALLGGKHCKVRDKGSLSLNPFLFFPQGDEEHKRYCSADIKHDVLLTLEALFPSMDDDVSHNLGKSLWTICQKKKRNATFSDIAVSMGRRKNHASRQAACIIRDFCRDYGHLFNAPDPLDLSNPLLVIEAVEIHDDKILALSLIQALLIRIKAFQDENGERKPFVLLIEEGWELLKGRGMGKFLTYVSRTCRLYNIFVILTTATPRQYLKKQTELFSPLSECLDEMAQGAWNFLYVNQDGSLHQMESAGYFISSPKLLSSPEVSHNACNSQKKEIGTMEEAATAEAFSKLHTSWRKRFLLAWFPLTAMMMLPEEMPFRVDFLRYALMCLAVSIFVYPAFVKVNQCSFFTKRMSAVLSFLFASPTLLSAIAAVDLFYLDEITLAVAVFGISLFLTFFWLLFEAALLLIRQPFSTHSQGELT